METVCKGDISDLLGLIRRMIKKKKQSRCLAGLRCMHCMCYAEWKHVTLLVQLNHLTTVHLYADVTCTGS